MFNEKDVLKIFNSAYSDFSKKNKINCSLKLVNQEEFNKIARKCKLVQDNLKLAIVPLVGALTEHLLDRDIVYASPDILNEITDDKNFVKAIFMHEFYHILFKRKVKKNSSKEELKSENRVNKQLAKDFPKLARYMN
ncbi:MAG: hypothetical protein Q7U68_00880 [Candidatus Roizmanbacteria bacterium]|nr:hypothetical protein [Candidatus Roizmanbacteria bacterium]